MAGKEKNEKFDLESMRGSVEVMFSKSVLRTWLSHSSNLLIGTLAYNLFVIVVLQPVLTSLFPPLHNWERVRSVFTGHARYTYKDLLPYIGPCIWILGNGLCVAMLNRNLTEAKSEVREDQKQERAILERKDVDAGQA